MAQKTPDTREPYVGKDLGSVSFWLAKPDETVVLVATASVRSTEEEHKKDS